MELRQCPYDGTEVDAEVVSGGSLVLSCRHCGASWETHGAWVRRFVPPDRRAVVEARTGTAPTGVSVGASDGAGLPAAEPDCAE